MEKEIINPWSWQDNLGFVHGNKITDAKNLFFLSGQTASDENGECLFPGDMSAQIDKVIENIDTVLKQGVMDFTHVVRLNVYVTDMGLMMQSHAHMVSNLKARGCRHAGTLLGVSSLASPGALIEIEVTAAM